MRKFFFDMARHVARSGKRLFAFVVINLLLTCVLFYSLEQSNGAKYGFLDSVYWTGITASSTGYGDILPTLDSTKILALWVVYTTWAAFIIAGAMLAAWLVANPFEDEVLDDTDDMIALGGVQVEGLNRLLAFHGLDAIEIPESVEELHGKPTHYDTPSTQES